MAWRKKVQKRGCIARLLMYKGINRRRYDMKCYVPKDPKTGKLYVNAVGTSKKECDVNLSMVELPEEVLLRLEVVRAELKELT